MSALGHFWTLAPMLAENVTGKRVSPSTAWHTVVRDETLERVRLSGRLHAAHGARSILVVVHGLGGWCDSYYTAPAVRAATAAGVACLRVNLRGADRSGEDIYHAGLTSDLEGAVRSEALQAYERIYLLGFSMGGHVVLRYAAERPDARVAAAVAVCTPLDIKLSAVAFDQTANRLYRHFILRSLRGIYAPVARRNRARVPLDRVARIRTIHEWDDLVVSPRFGFAGADDYYEKTSIGPRLADLQIPCMLVLSDRDPMVLAETVKPTLDRFSSRLVVHWVSRGGHMGFHSGLDLGYEAPTGLEHQSLAWLRSHV